MLHMAQVLLLGYLVEETVQMAGLSVQKQGFVFIFFNTFIYRIMYLRQIAVVDCKPTLIIRK